jgi:aspartate/methionine/tyrosine aminotransferase
MPSFQSNFDEDTLIAALEKAFQSSECPVKALILTNPHNPLSLCYSKPLLEACVQFCQKHDLHFISDEVYALSVFPSSDLPHLRQFVSALSLDLKSLSVDESRVHVVWSMSKDFGQSGVRMGVTVTQGNHEMAVAVALAAQMQVSTLTSTFVTALLTSPNLRELIALNAERLARAYSTITRLFKEFDIPYISCNAGVYVFAKLAPYAQTWDDESAIVSSLKEVGVLVSSGKAYSGPESEKGWVRVGFAVTSEDLAEAIQRMKGVFAGEKKAKPFKSGPGLILEELQSERKHKRSRCFADDVDIENEHQSGKRAKTC